MTEPALNLLFVCTANISRSAYAERRAAALLSGHPRIRVASAGIPGYPGRPMDEQMAAILREQGVNPGCHVSRSLDADALARADLVLTFEFAQHMRILDAWPERSAAVFGLNTFADAAGGIAADDNPTSGSTPAELIAAVSSKARPDSMTSDIADPYRRGRRAAARAASEIDAALVKLLPWLTQAEAATAQPS